MAARTTPRPCPLWSTPAPTSIFPMAADRRRSSSREAAVIATWLRSWRRPGRSDAKLLSRALRFFNPHFLCDLNVEPAQIGQLACFLFGRLATLPLQNDA